MLNTIQRSYMEAAITGLAWKRLVSKHVVRVERDDARMGYHVLHATKGWRFISDRRLFTAGAHQ